MLIIYVVFVKYLLKKWEYNGAVLQLFMDVPTAYDAVGRVILCNILMECLVYSLYTYQKKKLN
jgi:hypothetical protein